MKDQIKKINYFALIKYFYPLEIALIIVFLSWLMVFLYRNVYQTIIAAKEIAVLRQETLEESLAKEKFLEITQKIQLKTAPTPAFINNSSTATVTPAGLPLKNPFLPLE
jgi:hypothetical protein